MNRGFTLLEIILVIAAVAILSGISLAGYERFVGSQGLSGTSGALKSELQSAAAKAMSGVDDAKWGINLVNPSEGDDYYELFKNDAATVVTKTYLNNAAFQAPAAGNNWEIAFDKVTGATSEAREIILVDNNSGSTTAITVTTDGAVY